jgi:hypothetical protein
MIIYSTFDNITILVSAFLSEYFKEFSLGNKKKKKPRIESKSKN